MPQFTPDLMPGKGGRLGARSKANFWIQLHGRFIYIKSTALRDVDGKHRWCLEASLYLTALPALDGEKRLVG